MADVTRTEADAPDIAELAGLLRPFLPDPYGLYASVRPTTPLRVDNMQAVIVARFAESYAVLKDRSYVPIHARDPRIDPLNMDPDDEDLGVTRRAIETAQLYMPPDRHAEVRQHIALALADDSLPTRQEVAREMTAEVLDALDPDEPVDVVNDLAVPVPTFVAGLALGLPKADWPALLGWTKPIGEWVEMFSSPEQVSRSADAIVAARAYFDGVLDERHQPGAPRDVMAALAAREEKGLDREETLSACLHIVAANITTSTAISHGLVDLAENPDQWGLLAANPELAGGAVEEAIRMEPSFQAVIRRATQPGMLGDVEVEPDDLILVVIGAANRDPEQFPEPERFDIQRKRHRHLTFGAGAHFCSGAQIGRVTAIGMFEAIVDRVDRLSVDPSQLSWYSEALAQRQLEVAPVMMHRKRR
jgi:cytochrome P450